MAHQCLNGFKIIPIIQKSSGKGVPDHVGMNPFSNEGLFRHGFDKAINSLGSKACFFVGTMSGQLVEENR